MYIFDFIEERKTGTFEYKKLCNSIFNSLIASNRPEGKIIIESKKDSIIQINKILNFGFYLENKNNTNNKKYINTIKDFELIKEKNNKVKMIFTYNTEVYNYLNTLEKEYKIINELEKNNPIGKGLEAVKNYRVYKFFLDGVNNLNAKINDNTEKEEIKQKLEELKTKEFINIFFNFLSHNTGLISISTQKPISPFVSLVRKQTTEEIIKFLTSLINTPLVFKKGITDDQLKNQIEERATKYFAETQE